MKSLLLVTLALSLTASAFAADRQLKPRPGRAEREAQRKACAFGESTADLDEMLELKTGAPGKIWYKGEHLSLSKKERLNGLSSTEKKMILMAVSLGGNQTEEETLADFASSEGYITYFSHNSNGREFAIVASYPGDNEFGQILEIKSLRRRGEYKILSPVAVISDGDLEDCVVTKKEVEERQ